MRRYGRNRRPQEEIVGVDFSKPVPALMVTMDGVKVDRPGLEVCNYNRAKNVELGAKPWVREKVVHEEPIAIVGYGPSLNATWPRLREFKHIWSTSKAHDFLLERGIKPECHFDLDPRAYKADFITKPQKDIHYVLSTHIHPSYVRKLQHNHCDISLYHVAIDPKEKVDPRYPSLKARFDVGIQAAEAAFRSGWRDQHWFGIEYGHEAGNTHAGAHWGVSTKQPKCYIDVNGRIFECNRMFFHGLLLAEEFLCDRALVRITIHGDGLLGHFIRARGRIPRLKHLI